MKRWLCLALIAALCLFGAASAEAFDFSNLSLEELYELRADLNARIEAMERAAGVSAYDSGSYLVGEDIPEGDYVLVEAGDSVFAALAVMADGSEDAQLLAYVPINRQAVFHLQAGKWVTLAGVTAYPIDQAPEVALVDGGVPEGAYLVGRQIAPGRYIASPVDKAPLSSYSVYEGIPGDDERLIKFEILHDDIGIELSEGDYIELSGCVMRPAE